MIVYSGSATFRFSRTLRISEEYEITDRFRSAVQDLSLVASVFALQTTLEDPTTMDLYIEYLRSIDPTIQVDPVSILKLLQQIAIDIAHGAVVVTYAFDCIQEKGLVGEI